MCLMWILLGDIYPTVISSTAVNFISFFAKIGGSFSSFFTYYLYLQDPKLAIATLVVAALLSLVGSLTLNKETKGVEPQAVIMAGGL